MPYEYDVFLSYRRFMEWPRWVSDHFLPLFQHYLGEELGRNARVFFDVHDVESGAAWPYELASGLAKSRVLVCLWSRQYFSSKWCTAELDLMRAREKACNFGTLARPGGLIVPVTIHDGDDFPAIERITQPAQFQDVVNVRMAIGSRTAELLADRISHWTPDVKAAILRAPDFDPAWAHLAADRFMQLFQEPSTQDIVPSLGEA